MPFPFLAIGIMFAFTGLMVSLQYVMRPKGRRPDAFDSPQYSFQGLSNQYGPGTPNNTIYGDWMKIAPNIITWYKHREGDNMFAYMLTEVGFGVVGGIRDIKINDQGIINYKGNKKKEGFKVYLTHGESQQKVYEYYKKIVRSDAYLITEESPTGNHRYTVTYTLDNDQEDFQAATPAEPGYFLLYDKSDEDDSSETHEMVMYTGKSSNTLTGCRIFKSHTVAVDNYPRMIQDYQISKNEAGNVQQIIPFFQSLVTNHTKVEQVVSYANSDPEDSSGWVEVTTVDKIQRFSVVLSFYEGLYKIDSKDGSPNHSTCNIAIRWYPYGGAWAPEYAEVTKTRDKSTGTFVDKDGNTKNGSANCIGLPLVLDGKGKRRYVDYCYCTESDGDYVVGTEEDLNNNTRWDDIQPGKDWITFTVGGTTYEYIIKDVIRQDYKEFDTTAGEYVIKKVWKMKFLRPLNDESSVDGKYYGALPKATGGHDFSPVSYTVSFKKRAQTNLVVRTIEARTFSEYQWTNILPKADDDDSSDDEFLQYQKYKIAVKKLTPNEDDSGKGVNNLRFEEVQEMTNDDLVYPNKSLLGLKIRIDDKINGMIDNVTCKVAGKLVRDVQDTASSGSIATRANTTSYSLGNRIKPATTNGHYYMCVVAGTSGSTIPTFPREARGTVVDGTVTWQEDSCRTSSNYEDIFADMVTSRLYGRGKYLEMSAADYTNFYASLASDAAYCDQSITENGKTRKRMAVNFNVDFRKPLIDTLQAISKNVRAYVYWDGNLLKNYIDRSGTADSMFGNVNIIPSTFELQTPTLSDKINRFYTYFLNKKKDYIQDNVSRDYLDETFTADTLQFEEITLYGLTDRWRVLKLLTYLLRTSNYLDMVCKFETTNDGITTGIGRLFYLAHDTQSWGGQSGRILTVPSTTQITIDRAYTFSSDPLITYGILLRKDDGTVVERVVNKSLTTLGTPTQTIYLTATISDVSVNSIYIMGRNDSSNEFYKVFRCVKTKYKGNRIELYGLKYDVNIFRGIYSNDPVTAEDAGTVQSNENEEITNYLDDPNKFPPNVESISAQESTYEFGSLEIYIQPPLSTIWAYANIYVQKDDSNVSQFVGKTTGDPLRVSGLELGKDYTIRAESWSHRGKANPNPVETTIYLDGIPDNLVPSRVEGLRVYNNRGNAVEVFGDDFIIGWGEASGVSGDGKANNYQGHQNKNNMNESVRYLVEVYFKGLADTVKTKSNVQANTVIARSEITWNNYFRYSLDDNIEDAKKMFAESSDYYGIPQSILGFNVWAINAYGQMSEAVAYIQPSNSRPDMKDSEGVNTTPGIIPVKSGLIIEWQHPYREYDITHFLVKVAHAYVYGDPDASAGVEIFSDAVQWEVNTSYAIDDLVVPTILNGHVYKVTAISPSGNSGSVEPAWPVPNTSTAHPTVALNGITYKHNSIFRVNKVASIVKVTSTDEDVSAAFYSWTVNKLDQKKLHIIEVTPYDAFGRGAPSVIVEATPSITHSDSVEFISRPATPTGLAVALTTSTSRDLRVSWTAPSETDITTGILEVRYVQNTGASVQPTVAEIVAGVTVSGSYPCKASSVYVSARSGQAFPSNVIYPNVLPGWKYFFRFQLINSSEQASEWSHGEGDTWVTHSAVIPGIASDDFDYDFKKFIFTGTWSSTDADTVSWSSGTLKFKKTDGSTEDYSISSGNTGNMSAAGGWVIWQKSASTVFSYVTSINANQTAMAFCKPDTNAAFFAAFADTKEFMLTRSLISAGAVIASHISTSTLSAISADMGTLNAGKVQLSDSNDVRIYIDGDASTPVIRISKDGYEANSETNPDNLLFSSAYNYDKVLDSFLYTIPNETAWQAKSVGAHTVDYGGTKYLGEQGSQTAGDGFATSEKELAGLLVQATGSSAGSNEPIWETFGYQYIQMQFRVQDFGSGNEGWVRIDRVCVNASGSSQTFPTLVGMKLRVKVKAETIS